MIDKLLSYLRGLDKLLPPLASSQNGKKDVPQDILLEQHGRTTKSQFLQESDYLMFLENLFSELDGMEYRLCMHHDGSQFAERVLLATKIQYDRDETQVDEKNQATTDFFFRVFVDRLVFKAPDMACHRYASHVLETAISLCIYHNTQSSQHEDIPTVCMILEKIYDNCNFKILACDPYGSHVIRTFLKVISTLEGTQELKDRVLNIDYELAFNSNGSLVIQTLLELKETVDFDDDFIERAIKDRYASRCLECWMQKHLTSSTNFHLFYTRHIRGRMTDLITHPISHYIIKNLVLLIPSEKQLGLILDELANVSSSNPNTIQILTSLCHWAATNKSCDAKQIFKFVLKALNLKTPDEQKTIFTTLLTMQNGAQLLIELASFPDLIKPIYDGLLETESATLVTWAKDQKHSRPLQAYITAASKSRLKLIRKFTGEFATLSKDRIGSHIVDACFKSSELKLKDRILKELSFHYNILREHPYGKFVVRNCQLQSSSTKSQRDILELF